MKKNVFVMMIILLLAAVPAFAEQSLSLSGGPVTSNMSNEQSRGWQVEYGAVPFLFPPFGMALSYTNEGTVPGHKRDEVSAKLVLAVPVFDRFQVAAEAGPCRYNDTTPAGIQRGWGAVYGVSTAYRLTKSWSVTASWDRVEAAGNGGSDLFLLGAKFAWK